MNKVYITLKKLNGLVISENENLNDDGDLAFDEVTLSLNAEMMRLGYIMSKECVELFSSLEESKKIGLAKNIISNLRKLKGDDVDYVPFYPNFPEQVMNASEEELFVNAFLHYISFGDWTPEYKKVARKFDLNEKGIYKKIGVVTQQEFMDIFPKLLSSNESLSSEDKEIVEYFMKTYDDLEYPETIPYKETLCMIATKKIDDGDDVFGIVKTATDLLRVITYMNDGDVSLAENTRFKSLPKKKRKILTKILESVISEEDIKRHKNKWNKVFHNLHVGDFSKKVFNIAKKVRSNQTLKSVGSEVELLLKQGNFLESSEILKKRPGDFARRLDFILRKSKDSQKESIIKNFFDVLPDISTKVLLQLTSHLNVRNNLEERVVFPKGNTQRAQLIPMSGDMIDESYLDLIITSVEEELGKRFSCLGELGKVWIDERLINCPIPSGQRSSSIGLDIVARGTRLPLGYDEKNTLRFFIYWIGDDIDLSATLHDEDFKMIERVSYTNLKSEKYESCHSGDITSAYNGAAEFIDITIDKAFEYGIRYVVMNVFVYTGPSFKEHEKCYAGWMLREKPKSNEIFEPKTIQQKIDLTSDSRNSIPVVFDLKTKEMIWTDLNVGGRNFVESSDFSHPWNPYGNNVENNKASIEQVLKSIVNVGNKPNIFNLLSLHAEYRGELVEDKEEADTVFDLDFCKQINEINSEFLV